MVAILKLFPYCCYDFFACYLSTTFFKSMFLLLLCCTDIGYSLVILTVFADQSATTKSAQCLEKQRTHQILPPMIQTRRHIIGGYK